MIINTHQKFFFFFVPDKQFGQLINISPHALTMTNTVNTEFFSVEVWFTDQASKALEMLQKLLQKGWFKKLQKLQEI